MKLTFTPPKDRAVHTYCLRCHSESPRPEQKAYRCDHCGAVEPRAVIIDPAVTWWLDGTGEYWHEVSGVFVGNGHGEYLFFERTKFPFGLTVPAGHRDVGESPLRTAVRELHEETGITGVRLSHIATDDVRGDSCRRGSDAHRWHCFAARVASESHVTIDESEGVHPVWLTLDDALHQNPTPVTRYMITRHGRAIMRMA